MKKNFILLAVIAAVLAVVSFALLSSRSALDVVGNDSVRAFETMLREIQTEDDGSDWSIAAPDGGARFLWNGESAGLKINAETFVDAGLDVSMLSNISDGEIYIGVDFQSAGRERSTPVEDYKHIVRTSRGSINYHTELDHHGVSVGDGNMFEWAKDMLINGTTGENQNLDIVFVLNPEPLIAAGVDPNQVEGWVFAPVEMAGTTVDKFLKPFDLK